MIYFEEMGVADNNSNDPLKVLHPLLEPREKDIEYSPAFVGLSNSSLDAAKSNRLLAIPRSDMDNQELLDTILGYKIDEKVEK